MQSRLFTAIASLICAGLCPATVYGQERQWQLDAQGEMAFLVFGVPSTADIGISFWCRIGDKNMTILAQVPHKVKPGRSKVSLRFDNNAFQLQPTLDSTRGATTVEAKLRPRDRILAQLKTAQHFKLKIATHETIFPTEGADFAAFIKICDSPPTEMGN